jgi:hypothetical protein
MTGTEAERTIRALTLPSTARAMPCRPRVPKEDALMI